jgi:hypothetical protein
MIIVGGLESGARDVKWDWHRTANALPIKVASLHVMQCTTEFRSQLAANPLRLQIHVPNSGYDEKAFVLRHKQRDKALQV